MNRKLKNFTRNVLGKIKRDELSNYQMFFELEEGGTRYTTVVEAYSEEQAIAKLEDRINENYIFTEVDFDWLVLDDRGLHINQYDKED